MRRGDSPFIGRAPRIPAATLTLSVLLCIGALADGQAAAAVVAQNLGRHGTTVSEREAVASLLSSLNEAARKICLYHQSGSAGDAASSAPTGLLRGDEPTALRPYEAADRCGVLPGMLEQDMNLPPPVALF